jgi:voltage-gated potassium channel Kch
MGGAVAQFRREPLSLHAIAAIRLFFVALAIARAVLGFIGLGGYVRAEEHPGALPPGDGSVSNLIYFDIELFLVQSTPLAQGGSMPWELQIARFSAPSCVALYTIAELSIALFASRIRRGRLRRSKGHAIVCGSTRAAQALTDRLRAAGTRVLVVATDPAEPADPGTLTADPRVAGSLLAAGAARAAQLYACLELDEENAQVAGAAERVQADSGHPEKIYIHIDDLDLCASLQARRWSLAETAERHLDFFNLDELAAHAVVRADQEVFTGLSPAITTGLSPEIVTGPSPEITTASTPEIAIVGTGAFARSVLVESARQWAAGRGIRGERMRAVLIGDDAVNVASALSGRYAFLADACDIRPRTEPFDHVLAERRQDPSLLRLHRLYLCQEDEGEALRTALDAAAHLQATFTEVVVRLDRMTGLADGFRPNREGGALFDALGGHLRLVDVTRTGCDPDLIGDDLTERLARAGHQQYLAERAKDGEMPGSSPVLFRWEELDDRYKTANRAQVVDIGRKLAAISCMLAPRRAEGSQFSLLDDELERLAEREHVRWAAERSRHGWAWGPERDDTTKLHPDLVPWDALSEDEREKDRQAVRFISRMLADTGLAIVRGAAAADGGADRRDHVPRPPTGTAGHSRAGAGAVLPLPDGTSG